MAVSAFSGRLAMDGLVVKRTDNEYVDGPAGPALGGLTDPRQLRFARKTTTHTAGDGVEPGGRGITAPPSPSAGLFKT